MEVAAFPVAQFIHAVSDELSSERDNDFGLFC